MIINVKDVVVKGVNITVPTWVNWIAIDYNGSGWGYESEPEKRLSEGLWRERDGDVEFAQQLFTADLTNNEKWQDLLYYVGE